MAAITVAGWGMGVGMGMGATAPARRLPRVRRASVYRRRRLAALAVVVAAGVVLVLGAPLAGRWALGVLGGGPLTASEAESSPSSAPVPAAAVGAAAGAGAGAEPVVHLRAQPVSRATYVVAEGDTLWSIARRLQPTGDIRPLVDALSASRHGRPLQAGEPIVMPALPSP